MKSIKYLLIPVIVFCLILGGCKGKTPEENAASSEATMDNFLRKIEEGDYTMNVEGYLKTTAYSRDLVYFDYTEENFNDFTVMSVENESFQGFLKGEGLEDIRFLGEGQAIDVAREKLVSAWVDLADGNIYNFFYNDVEDPLKFVSYDDTLKDNVRQLVGNPETSLRLMHEVYLIMDQEDPTVVHIQAEMDDDVVARTNYDDIDIVITFGDAEDNEVSEAWMKDPTYPAARTGWTEEDEFIFTSVFMTFDGEEVLPFPTFASYALINDGRDFFLTDQVTIRDCHATEENVKEYTDLLAANGFAEVKDKAEDGTEGTFYRKMLREEYACYASVQVSYDEGMNLIAKKYYDSPVYEDLGAINAAITAQGYPELPASEVISSVYAIDQANATIESWLYFFDYDMVLYVEIPLEDEEAIRAYLDEYSQALTDANFHSTTEDETDEEEVINLTQSTDKLKKLQALLGLEPDEMMENANGYANFRYHFEDGKVTLLYKAQHYYTHEETEAMIAGAGFPLVQFPGGDTFGSRDLKKFEKVTYGKDCRLFVMVSQSFPTTEEAENFLNNLEATMNAAGYDRENPEVVGSLKAICIVNPAQDMVVGIDLYEEPDGTAQVVMDFEAY